ncbi:TetR family transcriptional regulator [Notoacmeibacter marinus]|uniref:TetR family transcriptional regulator n=1 Tax=Notoacmeibacter marinus TaxID=1876515 RepID=A0A231V412_9HYPH|nr:TetR/AcrR family transcriptional regulator [Notoacmeibacter marinus]OXT02919.1 TetR family transcriptional regulator [Notoacmeibacter marinus]
MDQQTDTRSHILQVGRRLTAQRGYTGVGLSELLTEAGVPKGSFYHYFSSKEAYGCALLKAFVDDYQTRLAASLDHPGMNGRERFLAYFADWHRNQVSSNLQDRCLVVKLAAEVADLSDTMSDILKSGVSRIVDRLALTLRQGNEDGSVAFIAHPDALAWSIYNQWLGASLVASLSRSDAPLVAAMKDTRERIPAG